MTNLSTLFPTGIAHYLVGGVLIGAGVSFLFVTTGLIGGTSSFFTTMWSFVSRRPSFQAPRIVSARSWRAVYALGMILGAALWLLTSDARPVVTHVSPWQLAGGGFIAGFGARMSNGCTAGHGICGLGSLQLPSLLAVLTFLATAIATANVVQHLTGF